MKKLAPPCLKTLRLLLFVLVFCLLSRIAGAQSVWNAIVNSSSDTNWSTPANWSGGVPTPTSTAWFNDATGNLVATTNSVVDGSFAGTISALMYTNSAMEQNTLIAPGVTLNITGTGGLQAATGSGSGGLGLKPVTTISGVGAKVAINNSSAVLVSSIDGTTGTGPETLDLSGLDTLTMTGARVQVGVGLNGNATERSAGILNLALTNVITLTGSSASPQIDVGDNNQNFGNASTLNLGQTNTISADTMSVGTDKQGSTAGASFIQFNPSFINNNPGAWFRGHDGVSAMTNWTIADGLGNTGGSVAPRGTIDFTGGTVNALVQSIWITRTSPGSTGSPSAIGTLSMGAGVIAVNNLTNGLNAGTTVSANPSATGTLNVTNNGVNGAGTLIVNNNLVMGYKAGTQGSSTGTLSIGGAGGPDTVQANTISAGGGTAVVNLNYGTLIVTNTAGTPAAPLGTLSLASAGPATNVLFVSGAVAEINATNLSVNGAVTINIAALPVITQYPKQYPLIAYFPADFTGSFNFTLGTLPAGSPAFQGYISNNVANNSIDLVLTNGPTVTALFQWTGAANSNWDLTSVDWKLFGSPVTYSNTSLVVFDDTTAVTNVNLTTNLSPGGVTMSNNVNSYTFQGAGALVGSSGLTMSGSGTLVMANSGINQFSGAVTINGGTLEFGNGGSSGNFPSGDAVTDNGNLVFNLSNNTPLFGAVSGSGSLVQNGSGVLSLMASNSYAGPTTANNGTLIVDGSLNGNGAVSTATGTTLGGNGTIAGAINAAGQISPGDVNAIGTLTATNSVTFSAGASLNFDLNSANIATGSGINDLLQIGGNLALDNTTVAIDIQGIPGIGLDYSVISYSGNLSGSFNPTVLGTHYTASIDTTSSPGVVLVDITGGNGANLKWNSTSSGVWNNGTSNWFNLDTAQTDFYGNGDSVLLDDSVPGAQTNLSIASGVVIAPESITNTGTFNYTVSGGGTITGPTSLYKDGSGTLTINTTNSFTGGTAIANGTLVVGSGTALGPIAVAGATIVTVSNAGTLELNGMTLKNQQINLSGAGVGNNGAVVNSTSGGGDLELVTLTGDTTLGGKTDWRVANQTTGFATMNTAGSPVNLTKVSTNQIVLLGCNTADIDIENVNIQQGSLSVQGTPAQQSTQLGDPNGILTISSNANFQVSSLTLTITKNILMDDGAILWSIGASSTLAGSIILTNNAANTAPGTGIVTNNGGSTLVVQSVITGPGNLEKIGAGTTEIEDTNDYTGDTIVLGGTLALTDGGAISNSPVVSLGSGTILDVSQRTDDNFELATNQTLNGNGTVRGNLTEDPGAIVAPGTSAVGTLTITNTVSLAGTTVMKLNATAGTSDEIIAGQAITNGGTLIVTNANGTLTSGQVFQLFSSPSYNGAFAVTNLPALSAGLSWNTSNLGVNGTLSVTGSVAGPSTNATITKISLSGVNIIVQGTNNNVPNTNFHYVVLTSTNVALPLSNWTTVVTNSFNADGTFDYTNAVTPGQPHLFYDVKAVP